MTKQCVQGVRVLDGIRGDIPSADVFIEGAIISDVRIPSGLVPSDWKAIPGQGCTIMPGLIDGHVHLLFDSSPRAPLAMVGKSQEQLASEALARARATLKSGVTSLRELAGTPKSMFSLKEALAGEEGIPRIFDCFTTLTAENGFGSEVAVEINRENAAAVMGSFAEKADFFKILGDRYDPNTSDGFAPHFDNATFAEICRVARDLGKPVTSHAKCQSVVKQCIANGVHSVEHAVRAADDELRAMAAQGIFLDATFLGLKCRADHQPGFDEFERVHAFCEKAFKFGVPLTMGSDAGAVFTPHAQAVRELEFMVQAGLPPMEAIRAATSVSARRLGEESLGAVKAGCKADLLLIGGDPLKDISAIGRSLRWVMRDGQIYAAEPARAAAAGTSML
jgi:imidazolonepropionase-like amidohydrolase